MSRATIQTSGRAQADGDPDDAEDGPSRVAAVSSCVMRYMTIITRSACGMWWVRIGMVAMTQAASVGRSRCPVRVGASSTEKPANAAAHRFAP
jgi:hypothetical protein